MYITNTFTHCPSLNLILSQFVLLSFIEQNPVSLAGLSSQTDGKRASPPFLLDAATPKTVYEFFRVFLRYSIITAQI